MLRVYRYRLYPTRAQDERMRWTCERLRELYNGALEERRNAYSQQGRAISGYQQMAELREVRAVREEYASIHVHLLQDAITRLDRAYRAFFRRVKTGEKAGFPRFRGRGRYTSFTFKDAKNRNGAALDAKTKRLRLTSIGDVKIKLHRKPEGVIKQVTVTLGGDGNWYACLCCEGVPVQSLPATGQSIGVDVGIKAFATLSNGEQVANPRHYERAHAGLRRAQRRLARRKRGSNRRRKAVLLLRAQHDRVRRCRLDFHHKVALGLVRRFDSIAVEKLNIKGLARGMLAKQVQDAAWGGFLTILRSKAECAGREVWEVDPRGTSQRCSGCGTVVPKSLRVRVHDCSSCGLVLDRDENAARNIHAAGHAVRGGLSNGHPVEPRSPLLAH
jgi:putative transposase